MNTASITLIGRVLLAALFLAGGLAKLAAPATTISNIAAVGLPLPGVVYVLTLVIEVGGGLLLLIGLMAQPVACALAVFTVAAAVLFHRNVADPSQATHFLKNLAIAGGLLQVMVLGAGRVSLDARRQAKA